MADCECLPRCPFFHDKMANKPATANLMKKNFCLGDNAKCARHQIFEKVGGQHVPGDLFPSQNDRVAKILAAVNLGTAKL